MVLEYMPSRPANRTEEHTPDGDLATSCCAPARNSDSRECAEQRVAYAGSNDAHKTPA